jgi:hypothetical protein
MASLEAAILRGQATRDAQTAIAATWVWDEKTVAQWNTELTAINTKKVAVSDLEGDMLAKRATYDNGIALLHDRTVEGLGMARVKWRKDEAKKHILSKLSAVGGGRETVQEEAQAWESVWEKFDAAWNPSPTNTIAAFRTLITDSDTQENLYKKAHTDWRTGAEELSVLGSTLWEDDVAWYEAATTLFKVGTAIGDMIRSTIPTSPSTPAPSALEIATATPSAGGNVAVAYTPGGGAHATTMFLQWKVVGVDADFGHDTTVNEAGQTVATGGAVGATVQLRTRCTNSTGTTLSTVKTVTLV